MATTATPERDTTATMPTATLDEILLGTAQDRPNEGGLPTLPDGWQHAGVVRRLDDAPPARREGMMAMGFGLLALVWAPMGIMAVIAGTEDAFIALSVLLAVLVLAPRPTSVATTLAALGDRVRPALDRAVSGARDVTDRARTETSPGTDRIGAAARRTVTKVRRAAGPALETVRGKLAHAAVRVRARIADLRTTFREAGERGGQVSASSQSSGLSDPLSRWLDGQSTPSSSR